MQPPEFTFYFLVDYLKIINFFLEKTKTEPNFGKFLFFFLFFSIFSRRNTNNKNIEENRYWILELTDKNADSYFSVDRYFFWGLMKLIFKTVYMEGLNRERGYR